MEEVSFHKQYSLNLINTLAKQITIYNAKKIFTNETALLYCILTIYVKVYDMIRH